MEIQKIHLKNGKLLKTILCISGIWQKSGWADDNGQYQGIHLAITDDYSFLPIEIQEKIKKEKRNYENSQRDGVFIHNQEKDHISITVDDNFVL